MNREEYLNQLHKYLKKLPYDDYVDAMDYFTEYFDEAGADGEQAAMEALGSPKQAANDVLSHLLEKQKDSSTKNWSLKQIFGLTGLALLAAPIGLPLAFAVVMLIFSMILLGFSLLIALASFAFAGFLIGGKLILRGMLALPFSLPGGLTLIGAGAILVGISIFTLPLWPYLWRKGKKMTLSLLARITNRKKVNYS